MDLILGIDLGTTNSVVSIIRDGSVQVLEEDGQTLLPSVVGLDHEGKLLVGYPAQNQFTLAPDRTVRSIKRKMGFAETVKLGDQFFSPQEISAIILRTLKERAARQLGQEIKRAVITVPAFFNEQQREATREAGELAGLDVVRIINEPTAAALTYDTESDGLQRWMVYDLGGGTFDVSIVQVERGVVEVLASRGDTHLGGDDFDALLLDMVCEKFEQQQGVDLRMSLGSRARVLRAVEEAKKQLSTEPVVSITEEFIADKENVPLHLTMEVSRLDYELLIDPLLSKTLVCVDEALADAKLTANQIDRVILAGGATRTPMVHRLLGGQLGRPLHSEINPDLCVSMGAAIQGGLIAGIDVGPVLVDITPHTLGIQCRGSVNGLPSTNCFAPLIERNTPLPASRSELFGTCYDGQDSVLISVYQGEDEDVRHNEFVGEFWLEGLADAKQGNELLIRFDLDLDGILTVAARERATGLEQQLTIDNAMSRFRRLNHEDAQGRLDSIFETPTVPQRTDEPLAEGSAGPDASSSEVREESAKARDLIERSLALAQEATSEDAHEISLLVSQLRLAVSHQSLEEMRRISATLDDLVFYLEDA